MTSTLSQILTAIILAALAIVLVWGYLRYKAAGSDRRLQAMLEKVGVDRTIAESRDNEAIMKEVRSRCGRCQTEDVCERWLAGAVEGDNEFCPNAGIFEVLAGSPRSRTP